jgi:sialidase-like protein
MQSMPQSVVRFTTMSLFAAILLLPTACNAQTGTEYEPVRYIGGESIDLAPHDGRLRPAIGVVNCQTMRANRSHPERADGHGWTYNHAPMLAYWNDTFYQQYLSNPIDEHKAPGQTLIVTSKDGRNWDPPTVVFPAYEAPPNTPMPKRAKGYMMHQRMGFYVAPNGRLLVLAFYGHAEDPFMKGGIGRVVREAYKDGSYGPIYFIRYTSHMKWNESNTAYLLYTRSDDTEFVQACEALLSDKLMTLQWWDEDRGPKDFYPIKSAGEALSFYHRKDGRTVALWKWSLGALAPDDGASFSDPVNLRTLTMDGAKIWGQRTPDGRYALVYNPTTHGEHRYPLAIVTGDDGILFDDLLLVHGEVPPRRFFGRWKDYGPQYVRGIAEGNGVPPGNAMWITYSVNKEDMWVSRIPTPVRYSIEGAVAENFDDMESGGEVPDWNIYSPKWAPVGVVDFPNAESKSLELRDEDPYDYAKAVRVFQKGTTAQISFQVCPRQREDGTLEIEILDRYGNRPIQIQFDADGQIKANKGSTSTALQTYEADKWYKLDITVAATPFGSYSLSIDGKSVLEKTALAEAVLSVERLSFRTGAYRDQPTRDTRNQRKHDALPGADDPIPATVYNVRSVYVTSCM